MIRLHFKKVTGLLDTKTLWNSAWIIICVHEIQIADKPWSFVIHHRSNLAEHAHLDFETSCKTCQEKKKKME